MKRDALLIWTAGLYEGCGSIMMTPEEGPLKKYLAISINFPTNDPSICTRLEAVVNNGTASNIGFEVGGYSAVRGFLHEIWPYLSPAGKSQANAALKHYKVNKNLVSS